MKDWQPARMVLGNNLGASVPPQPQPQPQPRPLDDNYSAHTEDGMQNNYGGWQGNMDNPMLAMPPKNYMVWAILTTCLCNIICGIVAIIYSSKVNNYWVMGNKAAAYDAQKKTKIWCIAGVVVSFVLSVLYIILFAVASVNY